MKQGNNDDGRQPTEWFRLITPALLLGLMAQVWAASNTLEMRLSKIETRIDAFNAQQLRNMANIEIIRDTQQQRGPRIEALEKFADRYRDTHYEREAKAGK